MGAEHFWINRTIELVAPPDCIVRTTQLFSGTSVADDWPGLGVFAHRDGRHGPGEGWILANLQPVHDAAERHSAAAVDGRFRERLSRGRRHHAAGQQTWSG